MCTMNGKNKAQVVAGYFDCYRYFTCSLFHANFAKYLSESVYCGSYKCHFFSTLERAARVRCRLSLITKSVGKLGLKKKQRKIHMHICIHLQLFSYGTCRMKFARGYVFVQCRPTCRECIDRLFG